MSAPIEVNLNVWITAKDDDEADRVIAVLRDGGRTHPATPIVQITELSRREARAPCRTCDGRGAIYTQGNYISDCPACDRIPF